ncbi:class I histocompatibility antigen, F10 alpha chain isoform X2 [Pogona vitticeps]
MASVPCLLSLFATSAFFLGSSLGSSSRSFWTMYTSVTKPALGMPHFTAVAYVDDQLLARYDSITRKMLPQTPWMKKAAEEDPRYINRYTQILQHDEENFRGDLVMLRKRYNQSEEAPVVKVTKKGDYDGMEMLVCQAYGFYPREIDALWTKDGEVWVQDTFHRTVAPNSDGTYHAWLSIRIDPKDSDRYRCHIDHNGLQEPLDLAWEEPASLIWPIILGTTGAVFAAVVVVGATVQIKKWRDGYRAASGQ